MIQKWIEKTWRVPIWIWIDIILDFMQKPNNNNNISNNHQNKNNERKIWSKSKSNNATDLNEELCCFALQNRSHISDRVSSEESQDQWKRPYDVKSEEKREKKKRSKHSLAHETNTRKAWTICGICRTQNTKHLKKMNAS